MEGDGNRRLKNHRSLDEAVAESDHGLDLVRRDAKLGAEAADVDVHRTRLDEPLVSPYALE